MFSDPYRNIPVEQLLLFHGMRGVLAGDTLNPVNERVINGRKDTYLFATPYISKVMQFAFDWRAGEAIVGGAVEGSLDQFVIVCESGKTLSRPISLRVYSFTGNDLGFYKTRTGSPYLKSHDDDYDTREFCTTSAVPRDRLSVHADLNSIDALMQHGLQIFSTPKTRDALRQNDFLGDCYHSLNTVDWLKHLLNEGFIWENASRGIALNPVLHHHFACP